MSSIINELLNFDEDSNSLTLRKFLLYMVTFLAIVYVITITFFSQYFNTSKIFQEFIKYLIFPTTKVSSEFYKLFIFLLSLSVFLGSLFEPGIKLFRKIQANSIKKNIDKIVESAKQKAPEQNELDILNQEIQKSKKNKNDQMQQLIEQRKEQLLIDDGYYRQELNKLIVDYLQPLPRNAKRLMNRFSLALLIASKRGLLTTEPKVTGKQVGKWLILNERWPQLGQLIYANHKILADLEEKAKKDKLQSGKLGTVTLNDNIDKIVPLYKNDHDLYKFLASDPTIGDVIARIIRDGCV